MADENGSKRLLILLLFFVRTWLEKRIAQGKFLISWLERHRRWRRKLLETPAPTYKMDICTRPRRRYPRRQKLRLLAHLPHETRPRTRHFWVKHRPVLWWTTFNTCMDDQTWREHFRMSRATFNFIVECVEPLIMRQVSNFRQPIPVRKRVAVALWRLATGCEYRTLQELFGVGRSTSCSILHEFITAVIESLKHRFLHIPTADECRTIVQGFRDTWGFPQCCGAVDGTHIPIVAPPQHRNDYYNRKGWYSVLCQAVVDHRYLFWDIDVGWPGKVHDTRVLANSTIYELAHQNRLFPNITEQFAGVNVPICLIGDPAYPLQTWLMKPYREGGDATEQQRYFNYKLSRARMTVECAFGRLKGRWRCLLKRNDHHISLVPSVVLCCAILHNICERRGELYDESLNVTSLIEPPPNDVVDEARGQVRAQAQVIRDSLCAHLPGNRF